MENEFMLRHNRLSESKPSCERSDPATIRRGRGRAWKSNVIEVIAIDVESGDEQGELP